MAERNKKTGTDEAWFDYDPDEREVFKVMRVAFSYTGVDDFVMTVNYKVVGGLKVELSKNELGFLDLELMRIYIAKVARVLLLDEHELRRALSDRVTRTLSDNDLAVYRETNLFGEHLEDFARAVGADVLNEAVPLGFRGAKK